MNFALSSVVVYYMLSFNRDRLHILLDFVLHILLGCAPYMPSWSGTQVEGW